VPGGKPLRKVSFGSLVSLSTSFLRVETGVPGGKPPAQVTASHCQCLGMESDGQ